MARRTFSDYEVAKVLVNARNFDWIRRFFAFSGIRSARMDRERSGDE